MCIYALRDHTAGARRKNGAALTSCLARLGRLELSKSLAEIFTRRQPRALADTLRGGARNDVLVYDSADVEQDGGTRTDTV